MAKKKGVNKSDLIRELIGANPNMSAQEAVDSMKEKGHTVSAGLFYAVKQKGKGKGGRKSGTKMPKAVKASSNGTLSIGDAVQEVRALANRVGGLTELQKIVIALHG